MDIRETEHRDMDIFTSFYFCLLNQAVKSSDYSVEVQND